MMPRGRYQLRRSVDAAKDQTYFLFGLTQEQLARTEFPLGGFTKPQVRDLARELGLPVAEKPDSQEICFVPNGDYAAFIDAYFRERGIEPERTHGEILDTEGHVLGEHEGVHRFTVGQRRGLRIAAGEPLYVIATEPASQRVIVGRNEDLLRAHLAAKDVNWISIPPISAPTRAQVKIRNKHLAAEATLYPTARPRTRRSSFRRTAARRHAGTRRGFLRRRPGAGRRVDRITFIQYLLAKFVLWSLAHSPLGLARFYATLLDLAVPRLRRAARRQSRSRIPGQNRPPSARPSSTKSSSPSPGCSTLSRASPRSTAKTFPTGSVTRAWSTTSKPSKPAAASWSPPHTSATGNSAPSRTP